MVQQMRLKFLSVRCTYLFSKEQNPNFEKVKLFGYKNQEDAKRYWQKNHNFDLFITLINSCFISLNSLDL